MEDAEVDQLRNHLHATALPMLLGDVPELGCFWEICHGDPDRLADGVVYHAHIPKYGHAYRMSILVVGLNAEELHAEIGKEVNETQKSFLPNLELWKIIHHRDDWSIIYQQAKTFPGISDRDILAIQFSGRFGNGTVYALHCSIPDSPKYPVKTNRKLVRAMSYPCGSLYQTTADRPNCCVLTLLYNMDLKGYVPKSLTHLSVPKFTLRFGQAAQLHATQIARSRARTSSSSVSSSRYSDESGSEQQSSRNNSQNDIMDGVTLA